MRIVRATLNRGIRGRAEEPFQLVTTDVAIRAASRHRGGGPSHQLAGARRDAESATTPRRFIAMLSHELRIPVAPSHRVQLMRLAAPMPERERRSSSGKVSISSAPDDLLECPHHTGKSISQGRAKSPSSRDSRRTTVRSRAAADTLDIRRDGTLSRRYRRLAQCDNLLTTRRSPEPDGHIRCRERPRIGVVTVQDTGIVSRPNVAERCSTFHAGQLDVGSLRGGLGLGSRSSDASDAHGGTGREQPKDGTWHDVHSRAARSSDPMMARR